MTNPRPNPYVGPRSFQTGETLYGRDRETLELLDLLIAERIVLLYSPSGAGKTSLIQAALMPRLRAEGFNVLPPLRMSSEPPPVTSPERSREGTVKPAARPRNRFILSALLSLEEHLPPARRLPLPTLAQLTLDEYLKQRGDAWSGEAEGKPDQAPGAVSPVLIFDQFEEVLTLDPTQLDAKQAFFEQVGEALRDRGRWALFSMREDYLAGLDPYRLPVPTRFATTYRLDLLGVAAAHQAIQSPARQSGVDFTDPAADKLISDLRRVQVQRPDGTIETVPGPYVEPVQLQVVCFRLWDQLPAAQNTIGESDLVAVGDVNTALADYYNASVKSVAAASGVTERAIREWFDRQLITEQGIRGQVIMEPEQSRGLSNQAIRRFEDAHLVRADERRGATWFELSHDRLIEPVRASNAAWFAANLSPFQQQADLWNRQSRPDGLLLRGQPLADAEKWAAAHTGELTQVEQQFLAECRLAHAQLLREQAQNRRIRLLAIGASILSAIALLGIVISLFTLNQLGESLQETESARATAIANEHEANTQKLRAVEQDRVSKMTSASLSQLNVDPETSLLLAMEAYSTTQNIQTDDALRQAVLESHLRATLRGHEGSVNGVAIAHDGKYYLTVSADKTARLWDSTTGKSLRTLDAPAVLWGAAFSPDDKTIAVTGEEGTALLYDLACLASSSATCAPRALSGHSGSVWSAAFSPDGATLATAGEDKTAILWDVASGQRVRTLSGHKLGVNAVAFSEDGSHLVTGSSDQTGRIWDLRACTDAECPSVELNSQSASVWNAAFSPDGKYVVLATDDQNAYQYDVESAGTINVLTGHNDAVFGVAYSPDGKYIATGSRDGTARVWDAVTGATISVLRGHASTIWSVAFSPDSQLLLTGSDDTEARVWNAANGVELRVLRGHVTKIFGADYSGDGKRVITVSADTTARVWDVATGNEVVPPLAGHQDWLTDGALNADGTIAATASLDNTARVWDLTKCTADGCANFEISGHRGPLHGITFSPDEKNLLTASEDGTAQVWSVADGAHVLTLTGHEGTVFHAFYSPDGKYIVTAGQDGTARIWDAAGGKQLLELRGHTGPVENAGFNEDGTLVITSGDDRTAIVWDVGAALKSGGATQPTQKLVLRGHTGPVTGAVFSHDGKFIVTASSDKTARLWDATTGAEQSVLRGHTDKVQTVDLSPDDRFVLTSSSDKTVRITLASIQDLFKLAQTRVTRSLSCDEWQTLLQEPGYCPPGLTSASGSPLPTIAPVTRVAVATITLIPATVDEPATEEALNGATATAESIAGETETAEANAVGSATATAEFIEGETATAEANAAEAATATAEALGGESATVESGTAQASETPTPGLPAFLLTPSGGGGGGLPTPTPLPLAGPGVPPTRTRVPATPTHVPATPTPALAPGVYVSRVVYVPLDAPNFAFRVTFINTTDAPVTYTNWRVPFFEPGARNSIGAPKGATKTIPVGTSELQTESWKVGVGQCTSYEARPVWEDQDGRQTPLLKPDGQRAALTFQLCP